MSATYPDPFIENRSGDDFAPAWWLPGGHLQTLWNPFLRRRIKLDRRRERIWLADGDFIDLDWHGPHEPAAPLVLVLHGLTGSSSSHYVLGLQAQLAKRNWASVAINWRGCSGEPNLLPRAYHSGASDDLKEVIAHLQAARPLAPLYGVGYSLGGNVLLKYLGETGPTAPLQRAVAVSVPYRLDQCADRIGLGFSRVYQAHFMREMVAYVRDKQRLFTQQGASEHLSALQRLGSLDGMRTFWDFDGRFTAPLHGYADASDYYRRASSRYFLPNIRVPTLLIQAEDDPFVFRHSVPELGELSATTTLELHRTGGHVGFVEGMPHKPRYYLERRIPEWLAQPHMASRVDSTSQHEGFELKVL
ncbi:hydrolase [Stutzerimonas zhaodongensis]|uniref:hydrolase n=1 Tax=Stutzerimonas zhaodongensis TaxID=1176257 RepID=UPI001FCA34B2|nr:hydrolase [Stutzerimonas zhaodongensis]MCQ4315660.1 hydrolase [Stutzerimonas zhaodongensis]